MKKSKFSVIVMKIATVIASFSAIAAPACASSSASLTGMPVIKTATKKKTKTKVTVVSSSKVTVRTKAAKTYAKKKKTIASALKGEKMDKALKKKVKKLKKLSVRMSRLYLKKGKTKKSVNVTLKVNNLTKKIKHVYILRYDTGKKKWYLSGAKANYKNKTVTFAASNFSTYAVVYTK